MSGSGLSPRVRGNQVLAVRRTFPCGSIPARAGEPRACLPSRCRGGVYPRACGGTMSRCIEGWDLQGLSPRVRGNQRCSKSVISFSGSIPARAGEPSTRCRRTRWFRVYPRACGGTADEAAGFTLGQGLSPRVRGNRLDRREEDDIEGSIPARAGEPQSVSMSARYLRVYPRACGGTRRHHHAGAACPGLSPRVRGNLVGRRIVRQVLGSIPARAGEPTGKDLSQALLRVYPRACGGTNEMDAAITRSWGLSPRVRGNRNHHVRGRYP